MSEEVTEDESYKDSFEMYQKVTAYLLHKSGGSVTINQHEFLDFPRKWSIESTLDVASGNITLALHTAT